MHACTHQPRRAPPTRIPHAVSRKVSRIEGRHLGGVKLPDTCLAVIMDCLVDQLEPGGVWGPGLVARDLANAALVSGWVLVCIGWSVVELQAAAGSRAHLNASHVPSTSLNTRQVCGDFYTAAKRGFAALAARATSDLNQRTPDRRPASVSLYSLPGALGWDVWDTVASDPTGKSLKLPDLKAAAKQLKLKVGA
jgi:hypothetical protein